MAKPAKRNATYASVVPAHTPPLSWRAVCPPSIAPQAPMVEIAPAVAASLDTTATLTLDGGADPRHDKWGKIVT